MMDLRSAAHVLGGEVSGRGVICPGPGHRPHDRSLSVSFDSGAPEGFLVTSFAGDDWRECRDHVKARLGMGSANLQMPQPSHAELPHVDKTDYARRIWQEAKPALGSPVETYLTSRGIELVPELSELRYLPRCPFKGEKVGAMIAPMTDCMSAHRIRGVHRTRLNPKDKAMLGPAKGAVVRLSPDDEVTMGLHICEGIETGLALLNMGFRPLWCALSSGGIANFPLLGGIEALTIFADNDESGAGERAARRCRDRWAADGREVRILIPTAVGTDFADRRAA